MVADEIVLDRYGGGEEARNAFQLVVEAGAAAFAGTTRGFAWPFEHRGRWAELAEKPGFVLVLARYGPQIVGFAHGCPNDDEIFELSELAVREPWRDRGVEQLLRDALLAGR